MKSLYESILSSTNAGKVSLVRAWLEEYGIKNYTINDDYTIDVYGDVSLSDCNLTEFPSYIQFGTVKGDFYCGFNQLTSLRGCPKKVEGSFNCTYNKLTTLKGAPREVGGNFYCNNNKLTSLEWAPKKVSKKFFCEGNTIKFIKDDVNKICKVEKSIIV